MNGFSNSPIFEDLSKTSFSHSGLLSTSLEEIHSEPLESPPMEITKEWTKRYRCNCEKEHREDCQARKSRIALEAQAKRLTPQSLCAVENFMNQGMRTYSLLRIYPSSKREYVRKIYIKKMKQHPLVVVIRNWIDPDTIEDERFLRTYYKFRTVLRDTNGITEDHVPLVAQAGMDDIDPSFANGFVNKLKNLVFGASASTLEVVRSVVQKVFSSFGGVFLDSMSWIADIVKKLTSKIIDVCMNFVSPTAIFRQAKNAIPRKVLLGCAAVITLLLLGVTELISRKIGFFVIQCVIRAFGFAVSGRFPELVGRCPDSMHDLARGTFQFVAQGGTDTSPLTSMAVLMACALVGGSSADTRKSLTSRAKQLTSLASAGTVLASSMTGLFYLLPNLLREAIIRKFAPASMVNKYERSNVADNCRALLSISKIPKVLSSGEYREAVHENFSSCQKILEQTLTPTERALFLGFYFKLLSVTTILEQLRGDEVNRPIPFAIHVASAPGVGKTMFIDRLMKDVADIPKEMIWSRPGAAEHWNGYLAQKVIKYDEFLVGMDKPSIEKLTSEYLELVSSGSFVCPMASVDNAVVGIKGTRARPDFVITMNNEPYNRPLGQKSDAFQRRRNCVIRMSVRDGVPMKKFKNQDGSITQETMNIDLEALPEEMRKIPFGWLRFEILPGNWAPKFQDSKGPYMDYNQVVEYLTKEVGEHRSVMERWFEVDESTQSVDHMINDAMSRVKGIPQGTPTVSEAIMNMFGLEAQGGKRRKKVHQIDGVDTSSVSGSSESVPELEPESQTPPPPLEYAGSAEPEQNVDETDSEYSSPIEPEYCMDTPEERRRKFESTLEWRMIKAYTDFDQEWQMAMLRDDTIEEVAMARLKLVGNLLRELGDHPLIAMRLHELDSQLTRQRIQAAIAEEYGDDVEEVGTNWLKRGMILLCSILLGAWAIRKMMFSDTKELTFSSQIGTGAHSSEPQTSKQAQQRRNYRWSRGSSLASSTSSLYSQKGVVGSHVVVEYQIGDDPCVRTGHAMGLKGRNILTFFHLLTHQGKLLKEGQKMTIKTRDMSFEYVLRWGDVAGDPEGDVAVIDLDSLRSMPQFPDITKHFATEAALMSTSGRFNVQMETTPSRYGYAYMARNINYNDSGFNRELSVCIESILQSSSGDCGLPMKAVTPPAIAGKYIGIHVAGTVPDHDIPRAIATIVTKDQLDELFKANDSTDEGMVEVDLPGHVRPELESQIGMEDLSGAKPNKRALRPVPASQRFFISRTTKIKPSPIQEHLPWKPVKQPAILHQSDPRGPGGDPVFLGVKDILETDFPPIEQDLLDGIADTLYKNYSKNLIWPIGKHRLDFVRAVAGVPGVLNSINFGSSPGYPLLKQRNRKGKRDFVEVNFNGKLRYEPGFRRSVEDFVREMKNGYKDDHIFLGYLKDELVKPSKVTEGRTRLIFANDVRALIAFRCVYGSLMAAFAASASTTPMAIGINQYSEDMQVVYNYLVGHGGKNFVAGDFKSFDRRCHIRFREAAYKIIMRLAKEIGHDPNPYTGEGPNPVTDEENAFMYQHETQSGCQIDSVYFETVSNHMSGCFWTTPLNCLVVDLYMRYAFAKINPVQVFDQQVRLKILGDDHINCSRDETEFSGNDIQDFMPALGQEYTSDDKDAEMVPYRNFDEITFLGAHPRRIDGVWVGAPKKQTLQEAICWERGTESCGTTVEAMIRGASLWDQEYFEYYRDSVLDAMEKAGMDAGLVQSYGYRDTQVVAAKQTAAEDLLFAAHEAFKSRVEEPHRQIKRFEKLDTMPPTDDCEDDDINFDQRFSSAQNTRTKFRKGLLHLDRPPSGDRWRRLGPYCVMEEQIDQDDEFPLNWRPVREPVAKPKYFAQIGELTTFQTTSNYAVGSKQTSWREDKTLSQTDFQGEYGTDSFVERETLTWSSSQAAGTIIKSWQVPYDLLDLKDNENVQNMKFERYIYWRGNVTVKFMINGTLSHRGYLCLYWYPLHQNGQQLEIENWTACKEVVLIKPNAASSGEMTIPFVYPRTVLNNYARTQDTLESLGTLVLGVWSPLVEDGNMTSVNVTMFTSFPESKFFYPLPKVIPPAFKGNRLTIPEDYQLEKREEVPLEAQGNSSSTYSSVTYENVSGHITSENTAKSNSHQEVSPSIKGTLTNKAASGGGSSGGTAQDLGAKVIGSAIGTLLPMDKPQLVGGAVPTMQAYPSLSRTTGLEPSHALQEHPAAIYVQGKQYFDAQETSLDWLVNRPAEIARFSWNTTDPKDSKLLEIPLNSMLGLTPKDTVPAPLYWLNQFMFWRADFVFSFFAAKTRFHSGRLRTTVGYGVDKIESDQNSIYMGQILDFGPDTKNSGEGNVQGEEDVRTVTVPFAAATEYLRTYEGPDMFDPIQDHSLGQFAVFVMTELATASVVTDSIEIIVTVKLENFKASYMRPYSFIRNQSAVSPAKAQLDKPMEVADEFTPPTIQYEAQIGQTQTNDVPSDAKTGDTDPAETIGVPITETKPVRQNAPAKLLAGEKFPHHVRNAIELDRRSRPVNPQEYRAKREGPDALDKLQYSRIEVFPISSLVGWFGAWSGSLVYTFFNSAHFKDQPGEYFSSAIQFFPAGEKDFGLSESAILLSTVMEGGVKTIDNDPTEPYSAINNGFMPGRPPQEQMFVNGGSNYVKVTVGFQSIFEFIVCDYGNPVGTPEPTGASLGSLVWIDNIQEDTPTQALQHEIYQSYGDDFMYGAYRPPIGLKFIPYVGKVTKQNGKCINGWYDNFNTEITP